MKALEWIKTGQTITAERLAEAEAAGLPMDDIWKGRTLNRAAVERIATALAGIKAAKKEKKAGEK